MTRILGSTILVFIVCAAMGSALASPPVLQVDGEPFFPIGWYDERIFWSTELATAAYSQTKSQGMNTILLCYSNYWYKNPLSCTTNTLEGALANGMKVMVHIDANAVMEEPGYPLSRIDEQVDHIKGHDALLGYYLADEPEAWGITPASLQDRYAQIKGRDATHPIFVVHWAYGGPGPGSRPAETYLSAEPPPYTDVLMTDTYVVSDGTAEFANPMWKVATEARHYTQLVETSGKLAYISVVQAHSADGSAGKRSPTFAEQRYLSYAPIVEGARGLLYWMYTWTSEEHRNNVVGPIVREIQSLVPAIISNSTDISVSSNRDTDTTGNGIEDVSYLVGQDDNGAYQLIAVNNTPNALSSVTFELSGEVLASFFGSDQNIPVLFENRNVLFQQGTGAEWTITDNFAPFDVNVYLIPEPTDLALLLIAGLALLRRRRK